MRFQIKLFGVLLWVACAACVFGANSTVTVVQHADSGVIGQCNLNFQKDGGSWQAFTGAPTSFTSGQTTSTGLNRDWSDGTYNFIWWNVNTSSIIDQGTCAGGGTLHLYGTGEPPACIDTNFIAAVINTAAQPGVAFFKKNGTVMQRREILPFATDSYNFTFNSCDDVDLVYGIDLSVIEYDIETDGKFNITTSLSKDITSVSNPTGGGSGGGSFVNSHTGATPPAAVGATNFTQGAGGGGQLNFAGMTNANQINEAGINSQNALLSAILAQEALNGQSLDNIQRGQTNGNAQGEAIANAANNMSFTNGFGVVGATLTGQMGDLKDSFTGVTIPGDGGIGSEFGTSFEAAGFTWDFSLSSQIKSFSPVAAMAKKIITWIVCLGFLIKVMERSWLCTHRVGNTTQLSFPQINATFLGFGGTVGAALIPLVVFVFLTICGVLILGVTVAIASAITGSGIDVIGTLSTNPVSGISGDGISQGLALAGMFLPIQVIISAAIAYIIFVNAIESLALVATMGIKLIIGS